MMGATADSAQFVPPARLSKGDLVRVKVGERLMEEHGVVQTVWRSSIHEPGQDSRTEVVVRFSEGGGWFKEEDVERIGSTGKSPPPLWHAFPEAVRDVAETVALKNTVNKERGDVSINDLVEGRSSDEQSAMMQVRRQREQVVQDPFSQRGLDELKLFRAVMVDDVTHLQDIIMRMSTITPVDIATVTNSRGQTLLELAMDRGKDNCADFLLRVYGKTEAIGRMTAWQTGAQKYSRARPPEKTMSVRPSASKKLAAIALALPVPKHHASFAGCVAQRATTT
jgi:hypothetical protein